jgi:hypothetical protein
MSDTRRNVRQRREYLYRKSLEGKDRAVYEHKQKIKEAIRGRWIDRGPGPRVVATAASPSFCRFPVLL